MEEEERDDEGSKSALFYEKLFGRPFTIVAAFLPKEFSLQKADTAKERPRPTNALSNADDASDRALKGLKELSRKVKELVWKKEYLTYREVATQLIVEAQPYLDSLTSGDRNKEEQNIKRRVYDALNVLIASDILRKQGKRVSANGGEKAAVVQELRRKIKGVQSRICEKEAQREESAVLEEHIRRLRERNAGNPVPEVERIRLLASGVVVSPDFEMMQDEGSLRVTSSEAPVYYDEIEVLRRTILH